MTEAEILARVDGIYSFRGAPRLDTCAQQLDWIRDRLATLSLDLSTLPYLASNDRRPRHPSPEKPADARQGAC